MVAQHAASGGPLSGAIQTLLMNACGSDRSQTTTFNATGPKPLVNRRSPPDFRLRTLRKRPMDAGAFA
jgi:hypothetical protein